jgi:hypothetical protein
MEPLLNKEVNKRLVHALNMANKKPHSCKQEVAMNSGTAYLMIKKGKTILIAKIIHSI